MSPHNLRGNEQPEPKAGVSFRSRVAGVAYLEKPLKYPVLLAFGYSNAKVLNAYNYLLSCFAYLAPYYHATRLGRVLYGVGYEIGYDLPDALIIGDHLHMRRPGF